MTPSRAVIVPSGASHVTSSMLLALASARRTGSATIQSSLHQPGSAAASFQVIVSGRPSRVTSTWPAATSSAVHEIGPPARTRDPFRSASRG